MPRINDKSPREKKEIRRLLRERDGDGTREGTLCFVDSCMNESLYLERTGKDFDVCHLDDNPENWDMQNLFLATHKCNVQLTPHGKINHEKRYAALCNVLKIQRMRSILARAQESETEPLSIRGGEFAKHVICNPIMEEEFRKQVDLLGEVDKADLKNAMSKASSMSPDRCMIWMNTYLNPLNGDYEEFEKEVKGKTKMFIRRKPQ
jgi:hypothetical protein